MKIDTAAFMFNIVTQLHHLHLVFFEINVDGIKNSQKIIYSVNNVIIILTIAKHARQRNIPSTVFYWNILRE